MKDYFITIDDMVKGKEQVIILDDSAKEVRVVFPYGGTMNSVSIYADSKRNARPRKHIDYRSRGNGNSIIFSVSDIGRYYVTFGSCNGDAAFWLTIKQDERSTGFTVASGY